MNTGGGRRSGFGTVPWLLLAALGLLACGTSGCGFIESTSDEQPTNTTGPQPTPVGAAAPPSSGSSGGGVDIGEGAWVLDRPPEGFVLAVVHDVDGARVVVYQRESDLNDRLDGPLMLITRTDGPRPEGIPGAEEVTLHGRTGYLFPLGDDGVIYGTTVMWPDDDQGSVALLWGETVSDDEVLEVAAGARAASEDEWAELDRTLGSVSTVDGEVLDAVEEVVAEGSSADGTPYQLVALVLPDFPLNVNDRRSTCFRLDVGGETGDRRCDSGGWWTRFGGSTLVYGSVSADAAGVVLTEMPMGGASVDPTPIVAEVVRTVAPAPVAFFVVEVPGWCWVDVTVTDGTNDLYSMPGGLPAKEYHAQCMAGGFSPSTTAGP